MNNAQIAARVRAMLDRDTERIRAHKSATTRIKQGLARKRAALTAAQQLPPGSEYSWLQFCAENNIKPYG